MSVWEIVLIVLGALALAAMAAAFAAARRRVRDDETFDSDLAAVNQALAEAHAQDKGWEPGALQAAARAAYLEARPGTQVQALTLVQVVDRPGTDEDKAVFVVETAEGRSQLTLGRVQGAWTTESIS